MAVEESIYTKESEYRSLLKNKPDEFLSFLNAAVAKYKEVFNKNPFLWGDIAKRLYEIENSIEAGVPMGNSIDMIY